MHSDAWGSCKEHPKQNLKNIFKELKPLEQVCPFSVHRDRPPGLPVKLLAVHDAGCLAQVCFCSAHH